MSEQATETKKKGAAPKTDAEKKEAATRKAATVYKSTGKLTAETKLPKQARQLMDIIVATGNKGIRRDDLIKQATPVLQTRQAPEKILSFYQSRLVKDGLIVVENPDAKK